MIKLLYHAMRESLLRRLSQVKKCVFFSFFDLFICFVVNSSGIIYHKHLVSYFTGFFFFSYAFNIIIVHLMCIEEVG